MFEKARDVSWLHTIDIILGMMMERIGMMRKNVNGKEGILDDILAKLKTLWDKCAGYRVTEVVENGNEFTVVRQATTASENVTRYTIDVALSTCECGQWQEHGYPCEDAMAYFRLYKKMSMKEVFDAQVDEIYTYENQKEMLRQNIVPVCLETISPDGITSQKTKIKETISFRQRTREIEYCL
jgi:hypothetical protein